MSIRTAQKELTRQRILDAVLDLVAEGELAEVTVPDVARRSGASVATIYRYFPTKDALFEAAAAEPARARPAAAGRRDRARRCVPAQLWSAFAENMALLRHQLASDAGREMRAARYESSRQWFADGVSSAWRRPGLGEGRATGATRAAADLVARVRRSARPSGRRRRDRGRRRHLGHDVLEAATREGSV